MADPLNQPALSTPPGTVSHFPTTHSREQAWYYVCATLCAVITGTFLLLRLYTKVRIVSKVDVTDCLLSPMGYHSTLTLTQTLLSHPL